ncbi:glycosyl hydrolase, partial [Pseudomonas sp. CrR25]|nr:glycosyl hydrolase [Pseudomonas sp. CrR25]
MTHSFFSLSVLALAALLVLPAQAEPTRVPVDRPAVQGANSGAANLVAATRAGPRIVVVGDYGTVLLSDDGEQFRQARAVPVQSLLTDVQFLDAERGWAVGHDGVVLASADGGESWTLLRKAERPGEALLAVNFLDANHGFVVGQFGLALESRDGGRSWQPSSLPEVLDYPDMHINDITSNASGQLLAVAEGG